MNRRNFFLKLCAVATAPLAVKAMPQYVTGFAPSDHNWAVAWHYGDWSNITYYRITRLKRKYYKI